MKYTPGAQPCRWLILTKSSIYSKKVKEGCLSWHQTSIFKKIIIVNLPVPNVDRRKIKIRVFYVKIKHPSGPDTCMLRKSEIFKIRHLHPSVLKVDKSILGIQVNLVAFWSFSQTFFLWKFEFVNFWYLLQIKRCTTFFSLFCKFVIQNLIFWTAETENKVTYSGKR